LLKKGQMQVELCEIPPAGAPEIQRGEAAGQRSRWPFLSNLLILKWGGEKVMHNKKAHHL
jgi:hypothetical protein